MIKKTGFRLFAVWHIQAPWMTSCSVIDKSRILISSPALSLSSWLILKHCSWVWTPALCATRVKSIFICVTPIHVKSYLLMLSNWSQSKPYSLIYLFIYRQPTFPPWARTWRQWREIKVDTQNSVQIFRVMSSKILPVHFRGRWMRSVWSECLF